MQVVRTFWSLPRVVLLGFWICAIATVDAYGDGGMRVKGDTNPVQVYVTVETADGAPVGGLTAGDFILNEDGASQSIESVSNPGVERSLVVFVLDYSGSVREANGIAAIEEAVVAYVDNMGPTDYAAIIKFNGKVGAKIIQELTSDKSLLKIAASVDPGGTSGTPLYDSIDAALSLFERDGLPEGSRAIVAVTDGADTASKTDIGTLAADLSNGNISLFAIGVGQEVDVNALEDLTRATGGELLLTSSTEELNMVYGDVQHHLQNEYLVEYNSAVSDCEPHQISIQANTSAGPLMFEGTLVRCLPEPAPAPDAPAATSGSRSVGGLGMFDLLFGIVVVLFSRYHRRRLLATA